MISVSNTGYTVICNILSGGKNDDTTALFSFAPLTSCDTERSFSMFKNCLSERRRTFSFDNLRMYIVVQCNASFNHPGGGS